MKRLYYTPQEVAQRLGVSADTVMRRIHAGDLPALHMSERVYRIPIAAFERWERGWTPRRRRIALKSVEDLEEIGSDEPIPDASLPLAR